MVRSTEETRRKARSDYIFRRFNMTTIADVHGVSAATVGRWKKLAKADGDDWDIARSAHVIAGEGIEAVVSSILEDFVFQAQSLMVEIKNGDHSAKDKSDMLVGLADAMTKMVASAKRIAPKVSELGVAQDVLSKLLDFVRQDFPEYSDAILAIIEPFGEHLTGIYTT